MVRSRSAVQIRPTAHEEVLFPRRRGYAGHSTRDILDLSTYRRPWFNPDRHDDPRSGYRARSGKISRARKLSLRSSSAPHHNIREFAGRVVSGFCPKRQRPADPVRALFQSGHGRHGSAERGIHTAWRTGTSDNIGQDLPISLTGLHFLRLYSTLTPNG